MGALPDIRTDRPVPVHRRGAVVTTAVLAALAMWAVAVPLLGLEVQVPESPGSTSTEPLGAAPVIGAATIASLLGWATLSVLERITHRARSIWTVAALIVLVVSMPWSAGFTGTERAVLVLLHLAVAAVLVPGLRRTTEPVTDTT